VQDTNIKDMMKSMLRDGQTMGEVMFRGNTMMSGYYRDLDATKETMAGGWLHTGDLAAWHPDRSIQVKDPAKDIIISDGENVSSIEVEPLLCSHLAVVEAALMARPDNHRGETTCAFVKLKDGTSATKAKIIGFCQGRLPLTCRPRR
jgi:acyl-CoA synthetase (AMP-forming)/AMP-acid ligase II